MKKETKAAIAKFGVKLALKYTGAELLGDAAGIVAGVGENVLPETTKNFLEAFSDTTADFFSDKAGDFTSKYLTEGERYVNLHLARGICKVWEDALTQSLPKNRAANSRYFLLPQDSFQDFNDELEFFIEKFKQAQIEGNESLLVELFYDKNKSETDFYNIFFEGVQDEKTAEEAYWATLKKTLRVWSIREGKFRSEWSDDFPEDFQRELKKFLFGNLRIGLKEIFDKNEQFRHAFTFSVDLIIFDLIKKLPEKIKDEIQNAQSENRFYYSQLQARFSNIEDSIKAISEAVQTKFTQSWNPKVLDDLLSESQKQTPLLERIAIATEKSAENHQPPEKSASLPKYIAADNFPSHTNFFTGRGDVIEGIKKELKETKRATLHGISGLGKTSVLLEFAKRAENDYKHLIFLRATKGNAVSAFARLAEKVDEFAKKLEKDTDKADKFKTWLEENDGWLLLIDNVDIPSEVKPLLPVNLRGNILSTGNSSDITILGNEVEIKKMKSESGELLLYRRAKTLSDLKDDEIKTKLEKETETEQEAIRNIVKEFDGLPLALNLAGAYIHKFDKKFADYENLYQKSAHKLLEKQDINDQYQNDSVAKAFSLAFETISMPETDNPESKQIAETAVLFLKTASFLHSEAIPLEIFTEMLINQDKVDRKFWTDEFFYDEVFAKIAQFDLFEKDNDKNTVNIHRLVQLIINNKIETNEKRLIFDQIIEILIRIFPTLGSVNRKSYNEFLIQVETTFEKADKLKISSATSRVLYDWVKSFRRTSTNLERMEKDILNKLRIIENTSGQESQEIAIELNELAFLFFLRGEYEDARSMYQKAVQILTKVLGENHPSTQTVKENLEGCRNWAKEK